ncbi:MAG: hypothetical protein LVQ75_05660 [Candidatus Babeliales bacterium]
MLDAILKYIPAPVEKNETGLQLLVTNIDHSDFLGTIAVGHVLTEPLILVTNLFIATKTLLANR